MTRLPLSLILALAASGVLPAAAQTAPPRASAPATAAAAPGTCPAVLRHTMARLQDEAPQPLCQYAGQVLLVVNTASYCGFTNQYQGLEALHARYQGRGFSVLGFPSNDFSQETGSNAQIADFCSNTFGVRFPMFAKSSVKGAEASTFYRELAAQAGEVPRWNFHKYLLDRQGRVVGSFASSVAPDDPQITRAIEKQLASSR